MPKLVNALGDIAYKRRPRSDAERPVAAVHVVAATSPIPWERSLKDLEKRGVSLTVHPPYLDGSQRVLMHAGTPEDAEPWDDARDRALIWLDREGQRMLDTVSLGTTWVIRHLRRLRAHYAKEV